MKTSNYWRGETYAHAKSQKKTLHPRIINIYWTYVRCTIYISRSRRHCALFFGCFLHRWTLVDLRNTFVDHSQRKKCYVLFFSTIKIFRLPRSLESVVGFFMERWSVSSWNGAWFLHGTVLGFFMDRCPCTYARCDSSWNGAWFPHGTVPGTATTQLAKSETTGPFPI